MRYLISVLALLVCYAHPAMAQLRAASDVDAFYESNGGLPVWTGSANAERMSDLVRAIAHAETHGLTPADYHQSALLAHDGQADMAIDRLATDAYLTLANHLHTGRQDPVSIEPTWTLAGRDRDLLIDLYYALGTNHVFDSLEALAPESDGYQVLRETLALLRELQDFEDWPQIDDGPVLELNDEDARVIQLRHALTLYGDLDAENNTDNPVFDAAVDTAVRRWQTRIGLDVDGAVGPATLASLNRPREELVDQIRANLERWRWLPSDLGERAIVVNIADFQLGAIDQGDVDNAQTHNVIVGRHYHETPVFSDRMRYIEINPWWNVPYSIASRSELPLFQRDPDAVERMGFVVYDRNGREVDPATIDWHAYTSRNFPFRLRQRPGERNALGLIKFLFPNEHAVYLHDTPGRGLFARNQRVFSSGCVRVEDPFRLADWVVEGEPDWTPERLREALDSGETVRIPLTHPVDIHILYATATPYDGDDFALLNDIYGRDPALIAALNRPLQ